MRLTATSVDFVAFDPEGVITRETWTATRLHCPRCGSGSGSVWVLGSEPPMKVGQLTTRVFLCVPCQFVAIGLNGFEPAWDTKERVKQIFKFGFSDSPQESTNNLIVGVDI